MANSVLTPLISLILIQKEKAKFPWLVSFFRKASSMGIEFELR